MTQQAVALRNVTKTFGAHTAVDGLDLAVPAGSIYGFIGPNGSGKTTTLRMIMRILHPDRGEIEVLGQQNRNAATDEVGYLPEERGLYKQMKVRTYYFEHDYADGRDLSTYSIALHEAVASWEANARRSRLAYVDDGATLVIRDGRVGAALPELRLTGVERALYLFCDQYRSWREVVKEADTLGWSESDVVAFVRRMRELRLVATADGRYVTLAFPAVGARYDAHEEAARRAIRLDDEELRAIRDKVQAWGPALTPRERALLGQLLGSEPFGAGHEGRAGGLGRAGATLTLASAVAAKAYRDGTHRLVSPRETVERVRPFMASMGITRIANVTGLDCIGIPVVMVVPTQLALARRLPGEGAGPLGREGVRPHGVDRGLPRRVHHAAR